MASMAHHKVSKSIANELLEDLDEIRCPFTCDIDAAFIGDVLFEPNDHRLQILKWMLCSIHPDIENMMQSGKSIFTSKATIQVDSQVQILTSLASTMCLCTPAEFDLIRGHASTSRQLTFWKQLIKVVKEIKAPPPDKGKVLSKVLKQDGSTGASNLERMFDNSLILPPDIIKAISISKKIVQWGKLKPSALSKLKEELMQLETIIKQEQMILEDRKSNSNYVTKDDPNKSSAVNKEYKLYLVDLTQMLDAFQQIYINTYKPICNRKPEKFTEIGDKINDVDKLLQILSQTLQNLKSIQSHFNRISTHSSDLENRINVKGEVQPLDCLQSFCESVHNPFNINTTMFTFERSHIAEGFPNKVKLFSENTVHSNSRPTYLTETINSITELN